MLVAVSYRSCKIRTQQIAFSINNDVDHTFLLCQLCYHREQANVRS